MGCIKYCIICIQCCHKVLATSNTILILYVYIIQRLEKMSTRRIRAAVLLIATAILSGCHHTNLPHEIKEKYDNVLNIDNRLDDNLQVLLSAAQQHKDNPELVDAAIESSFIILGNPTKEEVIRAKNITKQELVDIGIESLDMIGRRDDLLSYISHDYNKLSNSWYSYRHDSAVLSVIKKYAICACILLVLSLFFFRR